MVRGGTRGEGMPRTPPSHGVSKGWGSGWRIRATGKASLGTLLSYSAAAPANGV